MRIDDLAEEAGVEVCWKPFLLGPVFARYGWDTSPFNIYPEKGRYMWRDMERIAASRSLAFKRPQTFPQFALTATRVAMAACEEPWLPDFCRTLFSAEYGRGEDIAGAPAVAVVLADLGQDAETLLHKATLDTTKQALRDRVSDAISLGIFGAPTFVAPDGELFWGDDRLEAAVAWTASIAHKRR